MLNSAIALDSAAQDRLLLLIGTLLQFPGVGAPTDTETTGQHDALQAVVTQMQIFAASIGHQIPAYSTHTIRKDIQLLRHYGILENRMYRWGYYLGTGALNREELGMALQALASQAAMQGDPSIQTVYKCLERRLRGLNLQLGGQLFYPVRTQLDRSIVQTNPETMRAKGQYKSTLFAALPALEAAIVAGRAVELFREKSPYRAGRVGIEQVYPLQLIYADIAWYLLTENITDGHLAISRVDRFRDYLKPLTMADRGINQQQQQLTIAHELLQAGWGLYLGNGQEQQLEKSRQLELTSISIRFFGSVIPFILEGEIRHSQQKLKRLRKNDLGEIISVDYCITLPPRSLSEFARWVRGFGANAQVISPKALVQEFEQLARDMTHRYGN